MSEWEDSPEAAAALEQAERDEIEAQQVGEGAPADPPATQEALKDPPDGR